MAAIIYLKELLKSLSKLKRENENSMVQKLINIAQNSRFAKNAPETQVQSVNNQLKQVGMGTMYVDAASAAETENGQAALNQLVKDGIVSEQELNDSITKGTQLEISPGAYFQTVSEENNDVISQYSTFDKGGKSLAAIKESRARAKKFVDLVNEFKEKKEAGDINAIVEENFTDPKEKEEMRGILPGNLENIPKAVNDKIEEVKAQIADLTGAQSKIDYIRGKNKKKSSSEVVVAENATTTQNAAETVNSSENVATTTPEAMPEAEEAWYTDYKKNNKKAPTIRDAYDIAYNEALEEANKAGTDEAKATAEQLTTLMDRLHTLEGLKDKVAALDIDDIKARTLLDEEAYKKVYLPVKDVLLNGPEDVRKNAKDGALILARVVQTFSQTYGESYENVAKVYLGVDVSKNAFNMPAQEQNNRVASMSEYIEVVNTVFKGKPQQAKFTSLKSGVRYPGERIAHVSKKHGLKPEDYEDIDENIINLYDVALSNKKDGLGKEASGQYEGKHIIARVHGKRSDYRVVLTFMPNGSVIFESAFKGTEKGIKNEIANHGSSMLSPLRAAFSTGSQVAISISMIKEKLGIVNDPLYQTSNNYESDPKDYVAYHNISEDNLLKSAELGGLPMPSIAVTKKGIPFNQFGGITLIGAKDIVDPEKGTDVWSRDAYTTRFPKATYTEAPDTAIKAFVERNKKAYESVGEESNFSSIVDSINAIDPETAALYLRTSSAMKYRYITEVLGEKVEIPHEETKYRYREELYNDEIKQYLRQLKEPPKEGSEELKQLSEKVKKALDDFAENTPAPTGPFAGLHNPKHIRESILKQSFYSGELLRKVAKGMYEDVHSEGNTQIDSVALEKLLDSKLPKEEYNDWINKEVESLGRKPVLQVGRKKLPLTLENIVAAMIRERGAGKERTLVSTLGGVLSGGAKKYKSIEEMKADRDNLIPNKEDKEAYDAFVKAIEEYRDIKDGTFAGDGFNRINATLDALENALKKNGSRANLVTALKKQGFSDITKDSPIIEKGMAAIEAAKKLKTDYFEAKPARAVSFNEFKGAVVPKGTSQAAIDFLKSQGLDIVEYDPDVPGDRQAKQEQVAAETQAYFQNQGQRMGAYDPMQNIIALFSGANQSTLVHETAHMWLTMLEKIAETNEKAGADLYTIQKWAAFSEENLLEYKGTKLEKEFNSYAEALRKNPNDMAMQKRYIQERFARGFERYLATGSAPTKELRGVFRRFKKWLLDIYQDVKNLGKADPPEEVKRIFDSMLATEKEVDAWAAQRKLDSMDMGIDFSKSENII